MMSQQEIDNALEIAEEWDRQETPEDIEGSEAVEFEVDLRRDLLHPRLLNLTHRPKACPRCGGALRDVTIEYMTRASHGLVVVRDVPALRCLAHGHDFLLEETLDRLEALIELERNEQLQPEEMLQVPVFQLRKTA